MRPARLPRTVRYEPGLARRVWRFFMKLLGKSYRHECPWCNGIGSVWRAEDLGKGIIVCDVCDGLGFVDDSKRRRK